MASFHFDQPHHLAERMNAPFSTIDLSLVAEGFSDPVAQAQACFRALLDAMARPGTRQSVPMRSPPGALDPATAALALTLFDHDTAIWLSPALRTIGVQSFLRFHTGCAITADHDAADFALIARPSELPPLNIFALGSDEFPDRSTTVVVQVECFAFDRGWRLRGPGIENETRLAVEGLSAAFATEWRANRRAFPRGVDLVFTNNSAICALPRSTHIEEE